MANKEAFDQLFEEHLFPLLKKMESQRIEILQWMLALLIGGVLLSGALYFTNKSDPVFLVVGMALTFVIIMIVVAYMSHGLEARYKKDIILPLVALVDPEITMMPHQGMTEASFVSSLLVNDSPDRYHSEDLITGKKGLTNFSFSEVHAEKKHTRTDGKGRTKTSYSTIFQGVVLVADFNKHFSTPLLIRPNQWIKFMGGSGFPEIKMDNPDFEKAFDVYGKNAIEGRYILSPKLMEDMLHVHEKMGGQSQWSFKDSNLFVAIPSSINRFEFSLWRKLTSPEHLKEEMQFVQSMIGIIEDLDLNTRIWTKE